MGVMARSAPRLNMPMPRINSTAPTVNVISSTVEKLNTGVRDRIYTITVTGSVETRASMIFAFSALKNHHLP